MTIKLDSAFEHAYKKEGFNRNNAFLYCMHALSRYDGDILNNAFNVAKVGDMINSGYHECSEKMSDILASKAAGIEDYPVLQYVKKDTVALMLVYMQEKRYPDIDKFVRSRRNIEFEVAANLYGDPVEAYYGNNYTLKDSMVNQKVAKMKEVGLPGYNVEKDPNISWDEHYFNVCLQVSRNSKCFSRKIGAILVRDKRIISTGYNGPPEGVPTCDYRWMLDVNFSKKFGFTDWDSVKNRCPRQVIGFKSGEGTEWCPAVHAEENTIINCARMGIKSKNTIMYMTCFPAGTEVVVSNGLKSIEQIEVDDEVLTKDGDFKKVIKKHIHKYNGHLINVKLKGLELFDFFVTPDHKIFGKKSDICHLPSGNSRSCYLCPKEGCEKNVSGYFPEEIEAGNLSEGDYVYVPTVDLVGHLLSSLDTRSKNVRYLRKDIPDEFFNDPDYMWAIGMYIAEGSVNKVKDGKYLSSVVFSLYSDETDYQEKLKSFFERFAFNVYESVEGNKYRLIVHSSEIAKHFSTLCGEGSHNKKIPQDLMFCRDVTKIIDGVWCGDGTSVKGKNHKSIKTTSKMLAKQLSLLLLLTKHNVRVYIEPEKIDKNGLFHKESYNISFCPLSPGQVNRKADFLKVKSTERVLFEDIDVYDLTVEDEHTYSVGPVAVHNCGVPCSKCMVKIINAGVKELVITKFTYYDETSQYLLENSDVKVRLYDFIDKSEIYNFDKKN